MTSALELGAEALVDGRILAAVEHLRAAVRERPEDVAARANLAQALRAHGHRSEALAQARAAAALDPRSPAIQRLLASACMLVGDPDGAIVHLRRSLALGGGRLSRYQLGVSLRANGSGEAIEQLTAAVANSPEPELPPLLRARALGVLADTERSPAPTGPLDLCSIPIVTEVFHAGPRGLEATIVWPTAQVGATPRSPAELAAGWGRPRVVALTGAGISSASGLATRKQLWRVHDRDDAVAIWRFVEQPAGLWRVVAEFCGEGGQRPSAAHLALAQVPELVAILTQNVDGLHQAAAAELGLAHEIVELHGTLAATHCHACGRAGEPAIAYVRRGELPPWCACGGPLRPDVVLFGEPVATARLARAKQLLGECEVLLVIGCAMDVAPASELPRLAATLGVRVVEVKRSPSRISAALGSELLLGPAEEVLPAWLTALTNAVAESVE